MGCCSPTRSSIASTPEGQPGGISLDFTRLLHEGREVSQLHEWYTAFDRIPFGQKRFLVLKLADLGGYVMAQLLTKLDRHPRYREIFVPQYEQLTGGAMSLALGEDIRAQVAALVALIPESRSGCRSNSSGSGRGC